MRPRSKYYDRMTGEERFHLAMAAMARKDRAEAAALGDSCSKHTYTMRDWSFHRRVDASLQLLTVLALELAPHLAVLRELDWQARYFSESISHLKMSGFEAAVEAHWLATDPGGTPDQRIAQKLPMPDVNQLMQGAAGIGLEVATKLTEVHQTRRDQEMQALTDILAGFDQFSCEHWAISGPDAIAIHGELFDGLKHHLPMIKQLESDKEAKTQTYRSLSKLWQMLLGELGPG